MQLDYSKPQTVIHNWYCFNQRITKARVQLNLQLFCLAAIILSIEALNGINKHVHRNVSLNIISYYSSFVQ